MLFSLQNLKRRSVRDPDGELAVMPKLLHGRAALKLVEQAIAVFEASIGRPRSEYDSRDLEAVMGDYRLGRCIETCLLTRYAFAQPQLESVLSQEQIAALSEKGVSGPSDLRFALWDAANTRYGGFAPPDQRAELLSAVALENGLPDDPVLIDTLLVLDSEFSAVLTLTGERPTSREMMRLYNRGAVQTLLAHSTQVRFDVSHLPGFALRRLYFMAKRRGVLVDVEAGADGGFALTLYGPEQAFGTADKYGRRLADVSFSLLRAIISSTEDAEVEGTASLMLHDRPYRFHLNHEVLQRLEYAADDRGANGQDAPTETQRRRVAETAAAYSVGSAVEERDDTPSEEPSFDSMVEARLYKEYKSLERQGYTHGWRMEREPEPLLAPGIVLIPDFAFQRGDTKVFMEIAGFWSPSYRERKLAKLRTLASSEGADTALILALPQDAVQAFTGLPYPVVPYKMGVRATDMLTTLDAHYGQREERQEAAQTELAALQDAARSRGLVPEQEIAQALQAYTRSELLSSVRSLDGDGCHYVAGVGLLSDDALRKVQASLEQALSVSPNRRISLEDAGTLAADDLSVPQVDIEALAQLWPQWRIERPSLFEAYLVET